MKRERRFRAKWENIREFTNRNFNIIFVNLLMYSVKIRIRSMGEMENFNYVLHVKLQSRENYRERNLFNSLDNDSFILARISEKKLWKIRESEHSESSNNLTANKRKNATEKIFFYEFPNFFRPCALKRLNFLRFSYIIICEMYCIICMYSEQCLQNKRWNRFALAFMFIL